ncbi:protein cordon-bleu isoform X2 [Hyperolius riggenbachi]|uniref:protein cordon-bleu isoform X2 n=1 Tax=Hyperolius riggenbachi TaxID=752182 RepID=UPI0035A2F929
METSQKPPVGKKIKTRAPLPPQPMKPHMEHMSSTESDGTGSQSTEETKENLLHRKVELTVCLPDGQENIIIVDGSKAVMDLLVDLCSQHHLNPAQHTLEACSRASQQTFMLRPNTLIGTLDVQTVFLKEKVTEVKVRKPAPKVPEKTIRLVVNYLGTQKAVVRVNPTVPLRNILPAVCEKCEFNHESVTLLRDAVSKEELDMSQSLNDLGIKELYVWNNKQEKNCNLSSSSDTAEREKKGLFGFLRSNRKDSKNEAPIGHLESDGYEEIFKTASTSGNRCEGFSTAPSSPSVNSRSLGLGASLSLSNISGIGSTAEVKKRRAPPPPKLSPQSNTAENTVEDKITEPIYATIQKDQQRKKRRAPPPPPPHLPNETTEDLEDRKSSTSNGRQVPQKPPRGTSRSPPQLMIPPPPPYPPPDSDITDPPVFENGAAITGTTKPIPAKRGKKLIRSSSVTSEEVLTADDSGSLNSYTEDSGIVSPPSDCLSLDLQPESYTKSERVMNQENSSNSTPSVDPQPARTESLNSDDSWSLNASSPRADEAISVQNGDEDYFITSQFQSTLAELDEDSEDIEDGDKNVSSHIGTQLSSSREESGQPHDFKQSDSAVPVTIIDEIPEVTTGALKSNVHTAYPVNKHSETQHSSVLTNNDVSLHGESVAKKMNTSYNNIQSPTSPTVKSTIGTFKESAKNMKSQISENEYGSNPSHRLQNAIESPSSPISVSVPTPKAVSETKSTTESLNRMSDNKKVEMKESQPPQRNNNKIAEVAKSSMWRQQLYEPKVGMTTFTVVPPKPDVKKYDRAVSLTASAIKIDDQGNLISPQSSFDKKDSYYSNDPDGPLVEKPLVERAKEFWRSSSMDTTGGDTKDLPVKKNVSVKNYNSNQTVDKKYNYPSTTRSTQHVSVSKLNEPDNGVQQIKPVSMTVPKENVIIIENTVKRTELPLLKPTLSDKQTKHAGTAVREIKNTGNIGLPAATDEKVYVSQKPKPVMLSTASQEKVIIIEKNTQENKNLPFVKPSKRTSSQYVASAIFKYTEPLNTKSLEPTEVKQDTNRRIPLNSSIKNNITLNEPKTEIKFGNKQEVSKDLSKNIGNKSSSFGQMHTEIKTDKTLSETQQFNGTAMGKVTLLEKNTLTEPSRIHPTSTVPSNAFLMAVREKSVKIEQANSFGPTKTLSAPLKVIKKEDKIDDETILSTVIDEPDSHGTSHDLFGPKAKLRPVLQKPVQQDLSLHTALMGAIQSGEGKEKLRKIQSSPTGEEERKVYEPENERSALLSAIRAHDGTSRLKKVTSAASEELQTLRDTETLLKGNEKIAVISIPPPPIMHPPPPPVLPSTPKSPSALTNNSVDGREALLDAIRSGQGAARLKKVPAALRTL